MKVSVNNNFYYRNFLRLETGHLLIGYLSVTLYADFLKYLTTISSHVYNQPFLT